MGSSVSIDQFSEDQIPNLEGKIAIVTGANTGLGFAVAKGFAKKNATVIIASRSMAKVTQAVEALKKETGNSNIHGEEVDLASFQSIEAFAASLTQKYDHVDILINNAAVFVPPHSKTVEGFEVTLGVNTLGSVLITKKLLPLLKRSSEARIISFGSGPMAAPHSLFEKVINSGDLGGERFQPSDTTLHTCTLSKLFLTMYSFELQRRLIEEGVQNIFIANSFPGLVNTGGLNKSNPDLFVIQLFKWVTVLSGASPDTGALSALFLATAAKDKVERYRSRTAGPGPNIKPIDLGNPDLNPQNTAKVFDLIDKLIRAKGIHS